MGRDSGGCAASRRIGSRNRQWAVILIDSRHAVVLCWMHRREEEAWMSFEN